MGEVPLYKETQDCSLSKVMKRLRVYGLGHRVDGWVIRLTRVQGYLAHKKPPPALAPS